MTRRKQFFRACVMPVEEKRPACALRDIIRTYNVQSWADASLTALTIEPIQLRRRTQPVSQQRRYTWSVQQLTRPKNRLTLSRP
jgi:hypothetical protein